MSLLFHSAVAPSRRRLSNRDLGHYRVPDIRPPEQLLSNLVVIKITGKICDPTNLSNLAKDVKALTERGMKVIIVHGAGRQIDSALAIAGIKTEKKDGVRITPKEAIPVIAKTMKDINMEIGAAIRNEQIPTVCVDNISRSLISATRKDGYGEVGEPESVDTRAITTVLRRSDVLVLSCLGRTGQDHLNVNADDAALAVAISLKAKKLIVLSDVPGVLAADSSVVRSIDQSSAHVLLSNGTITGGMVVKVNAMLEAAQSVGEVILASGNSSSVLAVLQGTATCTKFKATSAS